MYTAVWTVAIYNTAVYVVGECVLVFSTFVESQNQPLTVWGSTVSKGPKSIS